MLAAHKLTVYIQVAKGKKDEATQILIDDAETKFWAFISSYRAAATATMGLMKKAKADKDKIQIYNDQFETVWRKFYVNDASVRGTGWFDKSPRCSQIEGGTPFQSIICQFFKYGLLLAKPEDGFHGNRNTKNMFPATYPELFPVGKDDADTVKKLSALLLSAGISHAKNAVKMALGKAMKMVAPKNAEEFKHHFFIGDVDCQKLEARALNTVLSMHPKSLPDLLGDMSPVAPDKCLEECTCGLQSLTFTGTVGATVGTSQVGFCTPDTNPFQVMIGFSMTYEVKKAGNKCPLVRKDGISVEKTYILVFGGLIQATAISSDGKWKSFTLGMTVPISKGITVGPEPADDPLVDALQKEILPWLTANSDFEAGVGTLVGKILASIGNVAAKGAGKFVKALADGVKGKVTDAITKALKAIASALGAPNVGVSLTSYVGFDLGYDFKDKKFEFGFNALNIAGLTISDIPVGGPVSVGVQGYLMKGTRYAIQKKM
jgi:hypothetical protein